MYKGKDSVEEDLESQFVNVSKTITSTLNLDYKEEVAISMKQKLVQLLI